MHETNFELDLSSFSDKVYNIILQLLVEHRFQPGEKLSEDTLANQLGVSRTPVREALKRLAVDGLVVLYPRRGAFAKFINPTDINELYEVRRCLEVYAARKAMTAIPEKRMNRINGMIKACHVSEGKEFIDAELRFDREIHNTISYYCYNSRLQELLVQTDNLARFMRIVHFNHEELARENLEEHEAIWRAIEKKDAQNMVTLLEKHLNNRRERLLEHFEMASRAEEMS